MKVSRDLDAQWGKAPYFGAMIEQEAMREIVVNNNRQSRASRKALAISYTRWPWQSWFTSQVTLAGKDTGEKITKAKEVIQTCIDEPYRFINEENSADDPFHNPLVYLTTKGKDFMGYTGPINELLSKAEPIALKTRIIWAVFGGAIMFFISNFSYIK